MSDIRENLEEMKEVFGIEDVLSLLLKQIDENNTARMNFYREQRQRNFIYTFLSEEKRKTFPKVPAEEVKENERVLEKLSELRCKITDAIRCRYTRNQSSTWDEIFDRLEDIDMYAVPSPPEPKEKENHE